LCAREVPRGGVPDAAQAAGYWHAIAHGLAIYWPNFG